MFHPVHLFILFLSVLLEPCSVGGAGTVVGTFRIAPEHSLNGGAVDLLRRGIAHTHGNAGQSPSTSLFSHSKNPCAITVAFPSIRTDLIRVNPSSIPTLTFFPYFWNVRFQSSMNFRMPMSVRGCFNICIITLYGTVAICAPCFAASVTSCGPRILAAIISV